MQHDREIAEMNLKVEKEKLSTAIAANERQQITIREMERFREIDSKTIVDMYENNQKLNKAAAKQSADRKLLGVQNAEVKSFLDTPVPADLRRLLNSANATAYGENGSNQNLPAGRTPVGTGRTEPR